MPLATRISHEIGNASLLIDLRYRVIFIGDPDNVIDLFVPFTSIRPTLMIFGIA